MALNSLKSCVGGLAIAALAGPSFAEALCAEDAMLVFDGSGSMAERNVAMGTPSRLQEAQDAIGRVVPDITPYRDVGLLIYGPGGVGPCGGINVAFAPNSDTGPAIVNAVNGVQPNGLTPLADSIEQAAEILDYRRKPAVIVVVTDGYETCGGAPCTIAEDLSRSSAGLQIHVVGFNMPTRSTGWSGVFATPPQDARCLAEITGGRYVAARSADELVEALNSTLGCMLLVGREEDQRPA